MQHGTERIIRVYGQHPNTGRFVLRQRVPGYVAFGVGLALFYTLAGFSPFFAVWAAPAITCFTAWCHAWLNPGTSRATFALSPSSLRITPASSLLKPLVLPLANVTDMSMHEPRLGRSLGVRVLRLDLRPGTLPLWQRRIDLVGVEDPEHLQAAIRDPERGNRDAPAHAQVTPSDTRAPSLGLPTTRRFL